MLNNFMTRDEIRVSKVELLTNSHMVILGEHPPVEVWRDIIPNIHLSHILVVVHLVLRYADALL